MSWFTNVKYRQISEKLSLLYFAQHKIKTRYKTIGIIILTLFEILFCLILKISHSVSLKALSAVSPDVIGNITTAIVTIQAK